ncbi:MAG: DEAD/DEAH box helicase [Candidatus Bathyarchaeia archaeon]
MGIEELDIPEELMRILIENGYRELYPPQADALGSGILNGGNLVLASPTASGKTLVAEIVVMKEVLERGGKALYLTPLRALAREKYRDFSKYKGLEKASGGRVRVAITSGDYDTSDPHLSKYDVIISTNEKADSLLRHRARWLEDISVVVADEVHLLTDPNRGPTLEATLTRLRAVAPRIRVLALSATVSNIDEIADWLGAKRVATEWRPVPLREGVYCDGEVCFNDGSSRRIPQESGNPVIDVALETLRSGGQVLIFSDTRRAAMGMGKKASAHVKRLLGRREAERLRAISRSILEGEARTRLSEALSDLVADGVAFHHAGLSPGDREVIESAFRDGWIKALVATPTLAAGVNLPARSVIISSHERYEPGFGRAPISVLEYKQLCGRAGRPRFDDYGEAVLIARSEDERDMLMENYVMAKPERLWSKMAMEGVLRPHVLATIATGYASSEEGLGDFFGRTLCAFQYGMESVRPKLGKVLSFLYEEGMIELKRRRILATEFGRRVSELYIDPLSAVIIRDGLLNGAERITEFSFLHLISRTPDMAPRPYPRRREYGWLEALAQEHEGEFLLEPLSPDSYYGYEEFLAEVKCASVLMDWIGEVGEEKILEKHGVEPGDLLRLVENAEWLIHATREISKLLGKGEYLRTLEELVPRIRHGVKRELLFLVRIEGVGRVRARALYNAGYRDEESLRRATAGELLSVPTIGPAIARRIKEYVGGKIAPEDWALLKGKRKGFEQRSLLPP